MIHNKNEFSKVNDKKVLHKVKKQWVVVSLGTFMLLGGANALVSGTNISVKADSTPVVTSSSAAPQSTSSAASNSAAPQSTSSAASSSAAPQSTSSAASSSAAPQSTSSAVSSSSNSANSSSDVNSSDADLSSLYAQVWGSSATSSSASLSDRSESAAPKTGVNGTSTWTYAEDTKTLTYGAGQLSRIVGNNDSSVYRPIVTDNSSFDGAPNDVEHIILNQNVSFSDSSMALFAGLKNLKDIQGLADVNTSNVKNMYGMFYGDSSLTNLDGLEHWDTSNVTNFARMFYGVKNVTDFSKINNWKTNNVTDMNQMFYSANAINFNPAAWDVSKVTNMSDMFYQTTSLDKADFSNWNTGNVTYMYDMFESSDIAANIKTINNWDVSKVTDMSSMFQNTTKIADNSGLNLSNWNTGNVTSMYNLFSMSSYYGNLTNFDWLKNWNTSNVTDMGGMFNNQAVKALDLSNWDVSKVTNFYSMFSGNWNLEKLNIKNWDIQSNANTNYMFYQVGVYADQSKFVLTLPSAIFKDAKLGTGNRDGLQAVGSGTVTDPKGQRYIPATDLQAVYQNNAGPAETYVVPVKNNFTLIPVDSETNESLGGQTNLTIYGKYNNGDQVEILTKDLPEIAGYYKPSGNSITVTVNQNNQYKVAYESLATIKNRAKQAITDEAKKINENINADNSLTSQAKKGQSNQVAQEEIKAKTAIDGSQNREAVNKAKNQGITNIDNVHVPGDLSLDKEKAKQAIIAEAQKVKDDIKNDKTLTDVEKNIQSQQVDDAREHALNNIDAAVNADSVKAEKEHGITVIDGLHVSNALFTPKEKAKEAIDAEAAKVKKAIATDQTLTVSEKQKQIDQVDQEVTKAKIAIDGSDNLQAIEAAKQQGIIAIDNAHVSGNLDADKDAAQKVVDTEADKAKQTITKDDSLTDHTKQKQTDKINQEAETIKTIIDNALNSGDINGAKHAIDVEVAKVKTEIQTDNDLTEHAKAKQSKQLDQAAQHVKKVIDDINTSPENGKLANNKQATTLPQTGENNSQLGIIGAVLVAIAMMIGYGRRRKNK
ncbi:BspA family leucine-rich repeat surface protein [Fructilactobacillus vespulae]|uniref:BspA family leucine-rich repeat surface protein n=1 Tax=Fructilactobacillus vespulae TaxID=1249630 RepID=UPI0039B4FD53